MGTNGMTSVAREEMMRGDEVRLERTIAAREERTEVGFCQTSAQVALMSATKPFGLTSPKGEQVHTTMYDTRKTKKSSSEHSFLTIVASLRLTSALNASCAIMGWSLQRSLSVQIGPLPPVSEGGARKRVER